MIYYISDLHLDHKNIIKYENRPFNSINEMNEEIIKRWNKKVKKTDEVYILGDFAFCKGERANELLSQLNGKKYMIKGNHDSFLKDNKFDISNFNWIRQYAEIEDNGKTVILFHYPIAVWNMQHYGAIHLYGHVHDNITTKHPLLFKLENAYNVGVDVNDFEPKTLKELIGD